MSDVAERRPSAPTREHRANVAVILDRCAYESRLHVDACLAAQEVGELIECIRNSLECATLCDAAVALLAHQRPAGSPQLAPALELCARACEDAARGCTRQGHEDAEAYVELCRDAADACRGAALALTPVVPNDHE